MDFAGYFEDRRPERFGDLPHGQLLGKLADIVSYVKQHNIDAIYVALPIGHLQSTHEVLDQLQDTTASIYFVPDVLVFDLIQSRIDDIHGVPVMALLETPFYGVNGVLKRAFDLIFSITALIFLSPVMLLIALGVRLTSPGPCLFKQRRYGLAGNEIIVYKFRTMTVLEDDNDNIDQATPDDPRFTRFGAWLRAHSLDELPQFVNVLQGRMSVVGPRPHAVAHNEMYRKLIKGYMLRHKVLPGITGWAQVNGFRGETPEVTQMANRIQLDLEYLRKWSISMDVKIILRTLGLVFKDHEAH
jgi:putative colanic acid biosynthesis UDP-glucose lipid carrier transferase